MMISIPETIVEAVRDITEETKPQPSDYLAIQYALEQWVGEQRKKAGLSGVETFTAEDLKDRYIKFGVKYTLSDATSEECGWVDSVEGNYVNIQCDDGFGGERGITIDISEVLCILPYKPRP